VGKVERQGTLPDMIYLQDLRKSGQLKVVPSSNGVDIGKRQTNKIKPPSKIHRAALKKEEEEVELNSTREFLDQEIEVSLCFEIVIKCFFIDALNIIYRKCEA
jgi:hypothetical protein